MLNEVEEILEQIQSQEDVVGIIVVNSAGIPIKTTLDKVTTEQYAGLITPLVHKARNLVKYMNSKEDLELLRFKTKKGDITVATDKEFILIVIQTFTELI